MKGKAILLALALVAPVASAQYSVGRFSCGFASTSPLSCNGFQINLGTLPVGNAWLNDHLSGSNTSPNFIIWQGGMSEMPQATIGKSVCTMETFTEGNQTSSQCVFLVVYFHGGDPAANTYYTGEGTFHFDYAFEGSGITASWRRTLTRGAIKFVTY